MTLGLMAALLLMAAVSSAQDGTATSGISTEEERVRWSVEQTGISKKDLVLRGNLL
jgi:hypothetical protein